MKRSLQKVSGFTLIELIVVIVILGIMAAIAGPKFVNLQTDARLAVLDGVEGGLRSAATLVYSKALIEGKEAAGAGVEQVSVGGQSVDITFGYPAASATGIDLAIDLSGVTSNGAGVFTLQTNCFVTYTVATATTPPGIVKTPGGC